MSVPKSVMKMNKDGVSYVSNVDRAKYSIKELSRAALKDVARFLKYEIVKEMKTSLTGMKKSKRPNKAIQSWVRSKETDLKIGFGNNKRGLSGDTWYGILQEIGGKNHPKKGIIRNIVYSNIPKIIEIESQYLSAMEDEARALALIDEQEDISDGQDV